MKPIVLVAFVLLVSLIALVRCEDDPTAAFAGVEDLTSENFNSVIGDKIALVEFYAPWCGWCKRLAPVYKQLGEKVSKSNLASQIVIAKVNADVDKELPSKFGVRGYPSILFFKGTKDKPKEYEGQRTLEDFVSFIEKNSGLKFDSAAAAEKPAASADAEAPKEKKETVVVLTPENFDTVVMDPTKNVFVKFYAPWCGHCVRFAQPYEEYAAKAVQDDSSLVVAKVDASAHREIGARFGIRGFPTLKFFPATVGVADQEAATKAKSEGIEFSGKRDAEALTAFFKQHKQPRENVQDEL